MRSGDSSVKRAVTTGAADDAGKIHCNLDHHESFVLSIDGMGLMLLRDYQQDCVDAVVGHWVGNQRIGVVMPTGSGKTVVFSELCSRLARTGRRPLILVNRDELVQQTVEKLHATDKMLHIGVVKAEMDQWQADVVVGSVQTLGRLKRLKRIPDDHFAALIVDECHYAAADSYQNILGHFGALNPNVETRAAGFTATMSRTDKRKLVETWPILAYERSIQDMVEEGYLVKPRAQTVVLPKLRTQDVKTRHGDFADGDLAKAMAQADAAHLIAKSYLEHARNEAGELRRGIGFAPTIDLASHLNAEFNRHGIPSRLVIGETPTAERRAAYAATADGTNLVIWSVGVLTHGWDLPPVEVAIMARPTKSVGLYIQMAGRVLRQSPDTGKVDALILDVVGVSRLGLASCTDLGLHSVIETDEEGNTERLPSGPRAKTAAPGAPGSVEFVEVDPFAGAKRAVAPRGRSPWLETKAGKPFLPGDQSRPTIWLEPQEDGWIAVCAPQRGALEYLTGSTAFVLAAQAALRRYGAKPGKLQGEPSPGQVTMLTRFKVEVTPEMDKQMASDAISIEIMSRKIDGKVWGK